MPFRFRGAMQFAALTLVFTAACSDDTTAPSQDPLTAEHAEDVGQALMAGVYSAMLGFEGFDPTGLAYPTLARAPLPIDGLSLSLGGFRAYDGPCPVITPDPLTDADGDGVPDGATFGFDDPSCDTSDPDGSFVDVGGSFQVTDPGTTAGYDLTVNEVVFRYGDASGSFEFGFDGTRSVRATSSTLSLDDAFGFMFASNGQSVLLLSAWSMGFTAAVPGSVVFGSPLPSGSLTVDGAYEVTAPEGRWVLVVDTVTPLGYDAACADFVSGVLRAASSSAAGAAAVQVTYQGCGVQPQVVFVGSSG